MKDNLIQQTIYLNSETIIHTVNGPVVWSVWLKREAQRIGGIKGRQATIRKNKAGESALFVNDVTETRRERMRDCEVIG